MGITYLPGTVKGPTGRTAQVDFLVDSGATYTVLPDRIWREIGLEKKRDIALRLADGTEIKRDVSECHITLQEGDGTSPVILGEPGDAALLGVVTLEVIGLIFNPLTRTLHPMKMLLGSALRVPPA